MGGRRNAYSDRQMVMAFIYAFFGIAIFDAYHSGLNRQPSHHPCGNIGFIDQCNKADMYESPMATDSVNQ